MVIFGVHVSFWEVDNFKKLNLPGPSWWNFIQLDELDKSAMTWDSDNRPYGWPCCDSFQLRFKWRSIEEQLRHKNLYIMSEFTIQRAVLSHCLLGVAHYSQGDHGTFRQFQCVDTQKYAQYIVCRQSSPMVQSLVLTFTLKLHLYLEGITCYVSWKITTCTYDIHIHIYTMYIPNNAICAIYEASIIVCGLWVCCMCSYA